MNWGVSQFGDYDRYQPLGFSAMLGGVFAMWQSPSPVTVANTVTETPILTGAVSEGSLTIPAGYLKPATMIRITLRGILATAAVAPTINIKVLFGGVQVYASGAVTTGIHASGTQFEAAYLLSMPTVGAANAMTATGEMWLVDTGLGIAPLAAQSGTVNSTVASSVSMSVTFGTADPANSITLSHAIVEIIG